MGFFVQKVQDGRPYTGETDDAGNTIMDAAPGALEQLPYGTEFQSADWQYPDSAYAPFVLQRLRRISSGLNMSYNTLANDLTSVNFSSIRAGLMDEREHWKALQSWWIARFERPIFLKWLEVQLLNQNLNLPFSKFAKFATADFRPRRWAWVDPMRDVQTIQTPIKWLLELRLSNFQPSMARRCRRSHSSSLLYHKARYLPKQQRPQSRRHSRL
jgi:lambda family phage portal protein